MPRRRSASRRAHFHAHGTTLAGLMKEHDVDPHDFLADVHDIPLDRVQGRRAPGAACCRGSRAGGSSSPTATRLMPGACSRRSGCTAISTTSTTFTRASFGPSPIRTAMRCCASGSGSIRAHALLADDMVQNLAPAKALGMTTVWVDNGSERGDHGYDEAIVDRPRRPTSATGSRASWGTSNDE